MKLATLAAKLINAKPQFYIFKRSIVVWLINLNCTFRSLISKALMKTKKDKIFSTSPTRFI